MAVFTGAKTISSLFSLTIMIPTFCMLNLAFGVFFYFYSDLLFEWYIQEDGYVESMSAIFLLFTGIISFIKVRSLRNKKLKYTYFFVAFLFFFGAGEEVSWGQRFLGFDTPEPLEAINSQGDFTLHNIQINEVKINKLVFGLIMYTCILIYLVVFPYLNRYSMFMKNIFKRLKLPIPTVILGLMYCVCFFGLLVIDHGKVWELQELAFTSFIFMTFLYRESMQYNKEI